MTGWVKSLQCKSRAANDVVHRHMLPASTSCRFHTLVDVIDTTKKRPKIKPNKKPHQPPPPPPPHSPRQPEPTTGIRSDTSTRHPRAAEQCFPALTELPEGHPSRNVIEIIFHSSWSNKLPSPVCVDMVFKVQNIARTVARFEEYREKVKLENNLLDGAREDHARCLADGNEVMRFYSLGPATRGYECGGAWGFTGGKGAGVCTFPGSGGAHESAGGGRGRRAMLVCRVIAGRVGSTGRVGFDSVSGEKGELLVFDTRAVLPCFLIIYKV